MADRPIAAKVRDPASRVVAALPIPVFFSSFLYFFRVLKVKHSREHLELKLPW